MLLRAERSQLRCFGHLVRMPPGYLSGEVFRATLDSRWSPVRPRIYWRDYVSLGSPWKS